MGNHIGSNTASKKIYKTLWNFRNVSFRVTTALVKLGVQVHKKKDLWSGDLLYKGSIAPRGHIF